MYQKFVKKTLAAGAMTLMAMTGTAYAAFDAFLKIEGIEGESRLSPGDIDIVAFEYGVKSPRDSASGLATGRRQHTPIAEPPTPGGTVGKVSLQDFHFVKTMDKASPLLMKVCAQGQHIKEAKLTCRKAGDGNQQEFLVVKLKDCIITSYQTTGDTNGDDDPLEDITISPSVVIVEQTVSDGEGGTMNMITTYDLKALKK